MLYGNLIFIKKTGGDGSKFPITKKDIKIGRSEDCLIRIYNEQVDPEHCQLIIEDNGEAKLRNFSNRTVLNGKHLGQGDVTLSHGDVLEIGARSARWEYLPSSTNYKQPLSPTGATGRLVAVVIPQQRSLDDKSTPSTSASQGSISKSTPFGRMSCSKRSSECLSAAKTRKSFGSELISNSRGDVMKFWNSRLNLKSPRLVLHRAKVKDRKSISGMTSTKTVEKGKEKSRKSTLPSWKVKLSSPPPKKFLGSRSSLTKSVRKSTRSPKSSVKLPSKDIVESESENGLVSASKSDLKTPQRTSLKSKLSEEVLKSASRSALKTVVQSPSKNSESFTTPVLNKTSPKKRSMKSPSNAVFSTPRQKYPRLLMPVQSESKVKSKELPVGNRRMLLTLDKLDSFPSSGRKYQGKGKDASAVLYGDYAHNITQTSLGTELINEPSPVKQKSPKLEKITPLKKTPGKAVKTPRKSSAKSSDQNGSVVYDRMIVKTPGTRSKSKSLGENVRTDDVQSTKRRKYTPRKSLPANTPMKNTPGKLAKSVKKSPSTSRKTAVAQEIPSPAASKSDKTVLSQRSRKSSLSKTSLRKSVKASCSPRGVRRKLSPASNAERAAKKLKTSSPKKPDKNKKAALLVLGIASRNQLLSQNVKALLKRKIVKKAIKQSTAGAPVKGASKKPAAKISEKKISKPTKKSTKGKKRVKSSSSVVQQLSTISPVSNSAKEKTPTGKKILGIIQLNSSSQQTSPSEKSPLKQNKKTETGLSILSKSYASENSSPCSAEKSPENYSFSSNRRCSKRLSSKNETDRPDFVELCPTALGLIPKNVQTFKTPKVGQVEQTGSLGQVAKRRSLSLATPKNVQSPGIIKSASTSKVGERKSVRFSAKRASVNSEACSPKVGEITGYDFTPVHTPNVTVDIFVSPLTDQSSVTKKDMNESTLSQNRRNLSKSRRSKSEPATCVRKLLQSPPSEKNSKKVLLRSSRITASQSPSPAKVITQSETLSQGNLNDLEGVPDLFATPEVQKGPKNNLSDLKGVARLLRTPKDVKSPKNDLTDVRGVKKLFQTPRIKKSPTNDLTDVRGVKRLLKTPKPVKSPKNDLSDVRGVKKLLTTPKVQRSPKNDLSDVRGVKKLLQSPKIQKSPRNDLSNVAGVKRLLRTPRLQKSPKNELTDLRGVRNLLGSPKVQNDPKNDLSDLTGVKKLFTTPRTQRSPKNNLLDVSGVGKLFESPVIQKLSLNSEGTTELTKSLKSKETFNEDRKHLTEVKQLLISKSPESGSKNKKGASRKSHINDFRAIRGRRTIYSTPQGPKNDLSDPSGVRELFCRHKPIYNFDMYLTGVAELFELLKTEGTTKDVSGSVDETSSVVSTTKILDDRETEAKTRGGRLRKAAAKEPVKKTTRSRKPAEVTSKEKKTSKRKAVAEIKTTRAKRPLTEEEVKPRTRTRTKTETAENNTEEVKSSRKRKAQNENSETSPPKLRRGLKAVGTSTSTADPGSSRRTRSEAEGKKPIGVKSVKKAPTKASQVQSKTVAKTRTKTMRKVQSRSQTSSETVSDSEKKASPVKTRSAKAKAPTQTKLSKSVTGGRKVVKSTTTGRKKASPVVKRSTRQKQS